MTKYEFTISAEATQSARVIVEADSLEGAQDIALQPHFFQDPELAQFELDEGNIIRDVYLPDPSDYEIIPDDAASLATGKAIREAWITSPLIERYNEEFCVGTGQVAGAVLTENNRIVFANADRDDYYIIAVKDGKYAVLHTHDALVAIDPDADLEVLEKDENLEVCVLSVFREMGFEPSASAAP